MDVVDILLLSVLIFLGAMLYSSVGHGGASAYLAVMALYGIAPAEMKPTALMLNILVSGVGTWKYYKAGLFSWSIFLPVAIAAVPFSFIGGYITVPGGIYKMITGIILLFAAFRLLAGRADTEQPARSMPLTFALFTGAAIGLLSGMIGVGGGIFLSPLLIFAGWASAKTTSGISAMFILVNSIAGLAGRFFAGSAALPGYFWAVAVAAIVGGLIGSHIGSGKAANRMVLRLLAAVLVIAGAKLLFGL